MTKKNNWLALALITAVAFTGCKEKAAEGPVTYTYRISSTAPQTWNPTDYQMGDEATVISLTSSGLYDFALNEDKDNYEVVCELAASLPQDVTAEYAGRYGVPRSETKGWAWRFDLIENACWEDGTIINADTWEYSFKQYLNPEMKNYRASSYYQDTMALANAQNYYEGKADWSKVGFIKNNDYSFTIILTKAQTLFNVEYGMSGASLVHPELYEANKKKTGDIIKTSYGTSPEKYSSCGPYKISSYQNDKEMKLERNEKWYGWTDGKHEGQYQTTNIEIEYLDKHETILSLFLQGKLDETGLNANDLKIYGNSEFRETTPQSYTWKFSFNSDRASLKKQNTVGVNHVMLSYKDFRKGLAYSLDRQKYVETITPASDAGYGLINYLYIADPETGIQYRKTPQAIESICSFYNAESEEDITGFSLKIASECLERAYQQALKDGEISAEDKIQIDYHTYNTSDTNMRSAAFLQDSLNVAAKGTSLEGKIFVNQVTDEDYYANMKNGAVDCALTGWGGASFNPYGITWCYCLSDVRNEYGFTPEEEKISIVVEGKMLTKTFTEWHNELNEGVYSSASFEVRNAILAGIEKGLLETYTMVPVMYMNSVSLRSHRLIEGSEEYVNTLVGYGGLRFLTWSMNDAEWEKYCKKNKNQLKY